MGFRPILQYLGPLWLPYIKLFEDTIHLLCNVYLQVSIIDHLAGVDHVL